MATKVSGKGGYLEFDGAGMMTSGREFMVNIEQNTANSTAGADEFENSVKTTKKVSATLKMVMLTAATGGSTIATKLKPGVTANLLWGFEGNAAGKPKGGIYAHVKKYSRTSPYDGVTTIDVEFEMAGDALLFDDTIDAW